MNEYLPDFLRGAVSSTMTVVLMMTLLQPKYGKKVTRITMFGILAADFGTALACYLSGNLTLLAKLDLALFTVLCFCVRPLFRDSFMQWLFSFITVQNIALAAVVLSFVGSRDFPRPAYANPVLRLIVFLVFYLALKHWVHAYYRKMVEHWSTFFFAALAICLSFSYYILISEDIIATLTEQAAPLLLITGIGLAAYISIFHSIKILSQKAALREENLRMQSDRELTRQRLSLMDEAVRQMSIVQHDRRHFNNTLLALLRQGETDKAAALLRQQTEALPQKPRSYCQNIPVNAAVSYYAELAQRLGIQCELRLDISDRLSVDELSLAMTVSNLMENAITAVSALPPERERIVRFAAVNPGQLLLEISNPYSGEIMLDTRGCPVAREEGHGKGTQSVADFVEKYGGELLYEIENGIFKVRLMV